MSILLHGHHANDERCPLSFDMDTAARVKQIETHKPEAERPLRLLLLREVDPDELPVEWCEAYAKWREAYAKYQEARAKCQEAVAKWQEGCAKWQEARAKRQEAVAKWQEARAKWQEARAKWQEADAKWQEGCATTDWDAWHREHCGGVAADVCKWTAKHPSIF